MNAPDRKKLLALQRKIYLSLIRERDQILGPLPLAIRRYEKEYQLDFNSSRAVAGEFQKKDLIGKIRDAQVTFIADFHTFPQAQRTALRLMRESIEESHPWAIGLEAISSQHQRWVNAYLQEEITEKKFLSKIRYLEHWGFPWEQYRPFFELARIRRIP